MAARKKVTKKSTSKTEKASPTRAKSKLARARKRDAAGASPAKARGKAASKPKHAAGKVASEKTIDNKAAAPIKKGAAATAHAGKTAAKAEPRKEPSAAKPATPQKPTVVAQSERKVSESIELNRRNAKGAEPAPARSDSGPVGVSAAAAKPVVVEKPVVPAAGAAAAAVAQNAAKAPKALLPSKPIERDPAGGEQKNMKNSANRHGFKLNEFVVYPAHGVGQIVAMEEQEVAGFKLELFVINFVKDKMTLRVPISKVTGVGMRKLSDPEGARRSLEILTGRARIKRTMWSRRAQEYEAKINSGDINAIAEVVRDLYRSEAQPEQSYSERQLYEAALDRMMREIAAVQKLSEPEAFKVIDAQLKKNTKRGVKPDAAEGEEVEEAA